jgi:hypothetical protein
VDDLEWLDGGGSWYDRRLRRDIDSIDGAVIGGATETPSAGRLAQIQGSVEHRLEVLSARVADLTELVDLRAGLTAYVPATRVRLAARRRLARLLGAEEPSPAVAVDDVAGYWLAPALDALGDVVAGGDGGGAATEAQRRDPVRAPLFLVLSLAVTARPDRIWPFLQALLPVPAGGAPAGSAVAGGRDASGGPAAGEGRESPRHGTILKVTHAARLGWIATAEGHFGPMASAALPGALGALLGSPERDDGLAQWVAAAGAIPQPRRSNDWAEVPLRAAARLAVLDGWCADRELPVVRSRPTPSPAVAQILRFLIEEGSGPEMALLERDRQLSDAVRGRDHVAPVRLDEEIGTVCELLGSDAFGAKAELRSVALRAAGAWVIEAADALRREAHLPPSTYLSLQIGHTSFKVTAEGVLPEDLTEAVQAAMGPEPTSLNPLTRHRENTARHAYAVETRARYEDAITRAVQALVAWHATCAEAAAQADRSFASIKARLGGAVAAPGDGGAVLDPPVGSGPAGGVADPPAGNGTGGGVADPPAGNGAGGTVVDPPAGTGAGEADLAVSPETVNSPEAVPAPGVLAPVAGAHDDLAGGVMLPEGVVPVAVAPVLVEVHHEGLTTSAPGTSE